MTFWEDAGQTTHDGGGFGRGVGEGEERLQTEWAPHHVGDGCGHWMPLGILPEDTAPHRAGLLLKMEYSYIDVLVLIVTSSASSTPHRDAAGEDALYSTPVEHSEDGRGQVGSLHPSQEVQALLCPLN
ncbi:hypothetical protein L3Q82_007846 [Scortum barcoo]|uniref:Uncharacterized protein n=1 Tax=Scortum barcoo TaxID=214431 RepID=A0ACB8WK79_9TELE|nr:hypothetical protein L3Q82_007846 [Scortum barcoo]